MQIPFDYRAIGGAQYKCNATHRGVPMTTLKDAPAADRAATGRQKNVPNALTRKDMRGTVARGGSRAVYPSIAA
eukprot:1014195-Pyramimonas_sp.AAC.1